MVLGRLVRIAADFKSELEPFQMDCLSPEEQEYQENGRAPMHSFGDFLDIAEFSTKPGGRRLRALLRPHGDTVPPPEFAPRK